MKRNLELIRDIMLKIEDSNKTISLGDLTSKRDEYPIMIFHVKLLIDAGFIDCAVMRGNNAYFCIRRLTMAGFDYLDSVRDATIWSKVKEQLLEVGGSAPLEIIQKVAVDVIARNIPNLMNH